ncbi:unnamed protein product [Adineta steineri]|uniref:Uncharacterized protein n=1 Tax=Adineta steineri TaxID=433720 RepID=A0A813QMH5_9BILA|nr:unnamed protein product [Adineta steineri]
MRSLTPVYLSLLCTWFIMSVNSTSHFDPNDLDWSIRPTDDFFTFTNGRWLNRTVIPPSQIQWGSIYTMTYETLHKLKGILDGLTNNGTSEAPHPVDSLQRKLADLYLSGLDEQAIEQLNIEPLKETLIQLENVNTYQELILFALNWYKKTNIGIIFEFDVFADDRNTLVNIASWKQKGLVLPERDYYFRNDARSKDIRVNYINYIDRLLNLTNHVVNKTTNLMDAEDVLTLEAQLAVSHRSPAELRDPEKNYAKYTVEELDRMMPNLGWHRIFNVLEIVNQTVVVSQLDYYQSLEKLIVSQSLNTWKNKIRFTILHKMANYLNKDFVKARFYMFDHIIYGRLEDKPKWMKIIENINEYIGESLGQLYVEMYFPSSAKQRTLKLVHHIIDVYRERLMRNEWMSDKTKEKAIKKLDKVTTQIGYPSEWKTYDTIHMNRRSYFDSISSIFEYTYRKKINDLHKPVDRNEWIFFSPQTVNAYNSELFNSINFPAAILQDPVFIFDADDAINYGAMGAVVGHELTHSFDDKGRKYDENGNLFSWWTPEDINEFNSRTKSIVDQYSSFNVSGTSVNGLLSLGENIADLGGLEVAYEAFLQTDQAKAGVLIDGLTPNQRFFLSYARLSRIKRTEASTFTLLKTDEHPPAILRVNAPLSNMKGFYETFNVTKTDEMYREPSKRVLIW